jgi:hypothetical protein
MKINVSGFLVATFLLGAPAVFGHPGSGIVVDEDGTVFVADINRGLVKFEASGKTSVALREAGHWLANDAAGKFSSMEFEKSEHWPRWFKHRNPPGSMLKLISDSGSPLVVHPKGNLYYVCNDAKLIPGGLQIAKLTPDGKGELVAPGMKGKVDELGGLKGLAVGPDGSLYATTPGAVLKVNLDGNFFVVTNRLVVAECERELPANTPAAFEPFLTGIIVNARGDIFLAATGCRCVVKLSRDGKISTILKAEAPWSPSGLALKGEELYVAEWTNSTSETHNYRPRVRRVGGDGKVTMLGEVLE